MTHGHLAFARHRCRWLLASLVLALGLCASPAAAQSPIGYARLVNGATAAVMQYTGGRAVIQYWNANKQLLSATVSLALDRAKFGSALAAMPWTLAAVAAFSPSQAGVDCMVNGAIDPWCSAATQFNRGCNSIVAPDSNNFSRNWMNYDCTLETTFDASTGQSTVRTTDPNFCRPIHTAMYNCTYSGPVGTFGRISEQPNYTGRTVYQFTLRNRYGRDCAIGDELCLQGKLNGINLSEFNALANHFANPATISGDTSNPPTVPLAFRPNVGGFSNAIAPAVPDVWAPVPVPGVSAGTPVVDTQPDLPIGFNPTTNPVLPIGSNPWTGSQPVTVPTTTTPTTTTTQTGATTTTTTTGASSVTTSTTNNINVQVQPAEVVMPDQMDVRCIEGCGITFEGVLEGETSAKTIDVPTIPEGSGFLPGQCPPPFSADMFGKTINLPVQPVCDWASALRGYILAMATLSGIVIVMAGFR